VTQLDAVWESLIQNEQRAQQGSARNLLNVSHKRSQMGMVEGGRGVSAEPELELDRLPGWQLRRPTHKGLPDTLMSAPLCDQSDLLLAVACFRARNASSCSRCLDVKVSILPLTSAAISKGIAFARATASSNFRFTAT